MSRGGLAASWIAGWLSTPVGEVPQVSTLLRLGDRLGAVGVRWGVSRYSYTVSPGLYAVGTPGADSPVFVTANYKLSFDRLRVALHGLSGWLLVLDTRGINVWCAAGKGTFGTGELVARIKQVALDRLVEHRELIVPQLGATGVAAHRVKEQCGFRVIYGPVRAADLPAFLTRGRQATPEMRRVTFTLGERLALIPMELVGHFKYLVGALIVLLSLSGLGREGYSLGAWLAAAPRAGLLCLVGYLGGTAATPLALPWLPGRALSLKGAWAGLLLAIVALSLLWSPRLGPGRYWEGLAWLLIAPALASFFGLLFTGSTPYTSRSGVQKEMRYAVPGQIAAAAVGLVLWLVARLH